MTAVVTTAIGAGPKGSDCPGPGDVLVQVLAAGINNTDINTRIGWYDSTVTSSTQDAATRTEKTPKIDGWNEATPFPLVQGTDCCGRVVAVAADVDQKPLQRRVLVRPCVQLSGLGARHCIWMGSDFDGAFAQFVTVPASEVFAVQSQLSDSELGVIPSPFGTAENMLHRARVAEGEHVLVVGASGGVGSAVVQLAQRRGATVTALAAKGKIARLRSIGMNRVIDRDSDVTAALGENSVDVIADNVAGPTFGSLLKVLKRGGRCVSSGAVRGPLVTLDLRTVYLKDLTLLGCTAWDDSVFPNLVTYIERGELRPGCSANFSARRHRHCAG